MLGLNSLDQIKDIPFFVDVIFLYLVNDDVDIDVEWCVREQFYHWANIVSVS